jgi:hypothetical protein
MRRFRSLAAAVAGGVAAVLLAGCSLPPGVDGEIADDWPALAQAEPWQPRSGDCHAGTFVEAPLLSLYKPIPCTEGHTTETVHVGAFPERLTPPPPGSPERRRAYAECHAKATEFLGDDWRTGRIMLGLAVPSTNAWAGGARWFRCDLWEIREGDSPSIALRSASLKDALRGDRPLGYGCYVVTEKDDAIESTVATDCAKPHNAEFAGVFEAPDIAYPKTEDEFTTMAFNGCWGVIARFAGVPNDGDLPYRTGQFIEPYSPEAWEEGNRGVRCFLYLDRNVTRSLKGAGPSGLPVT